jgi:hypothetical protein
VKLLVIVAPTQLRLTRLILFTHDDRVGRLYQIRTPPTMIQRAPRRTRYRLRRGSMGMTIHYHGGPDDPAQLDAAADLDRRHRT